jgi:hypothetical protein
VDHPHPALSWTVFRLTDPAFRLTHEKQLRGTLRGCFSSDAMMA